MTIELHALSKIIPTFLLAFIGTLLVCGILVSWFFEDLWGAWRKPRPGRKRK